MENTQKYSGHFVKNYLITIELDFHLYLQQVDKKVALWVLDMKLPPPRQINKRVTGCPSSVNTVSHNRSSKVTLSQGASLCFHSHTVGKRLLMQSKDPCPKLQLSLYSSWLSTGNNGKHQKRTEQRKGGRGKNPLAEMEKRNPQFLTNHPHHLPFTSTMILYRTHQDNLLHVRNSQSPDRWKFLKVNSFKHHLKFLNLFCTMT